jgi:hypothetical protein
MIAKLKLEKRGDEILKISSPLKLLSQSQPNIAVPLPKLCLAFSDLTPRLPPQPNLI